MTDTTPARVRPFRDRRALLERQEELAAAAARVDEEQQRLAVEFARLREELASVREQLWPSDIGRAFNKTSRPPTAGPAAIPPPISGAVPVSGRALRDVALRVLLRAERPLTLAEMHRSLHLDGYVLVARDPAKQLGDALGYEERRGVVRRVARGTYEVGRLTTFRANALRRL